MISVAVAGALAGKRGNGGEAWVRLSYALGLRRLGCDVRLVEEAPNATPRDVEYARGVAGRFGLEYELAGETQEDGDLLVNISGNVRSADVRRRFRRTAFVDIDPGFTQLWHAREIEQIPTHDVYFTIGANIGHPACPIPPGGGLAPDQAAGRARRVAGRRGRLRPLHHGRDLAEPVLDRSSPTG